MMKISGVMILIAVSLLLGACASEQTEEVIVRTVRTMPIDLQWSESERAFNGRAQTEKVINLSFRSSGVITRFDLKVGQTVAKGDLLAELDNVAARLAYEQATASLNSAKSDLDTRASALKRIQTLYERGGASLSDYENAKNAHRSSRATYRSAQRSVDIQQEQIRYGRIIAPENGVISVVNKELEENAAAGETIALLNAGSQMEIQVGIPESVINQVNELTPVSIEFASLPEQLFEGEVKQVSPSIDPKTGTYTIKVRVLEATDEVRSGMAASVNFDFTDDVNGIKAILVPAYAVGEDATGRYVFSIVSNEEGMNFAKKRRVIVGQLFKDRFEIDEGLSEGDLIVTAGVQSVVDGQQVRLQ